MIDLLHQTDDLWLINKPANLSLLRDRSTDEHLWGHIKQELGKAYLVHRLDKGTSGSLLVARNQSTQRQLTQAFAQRHVRKFYLAWVVGKFPQSHTYSIDLPLCKGRKSRYRVAGNRQDIVANGRQYQVRQSRDGVAALTRARCMARQGQHSLLLLQPKQGRTHQLRVHLSWIGFPIVGDHLYGAPEDPQQRHWRLLLHCHRLILLNQRYDAPVPEDFSPDRKA